MDLLNSNLMDNANDNLLNVKYFEKHYGIEGDSESEAEGEPETENEEYIEYENEETEIGDTSQTDLPKFRTLVRNKKLELKSQYGKAHIEKTSVRKCTTVKVPEGYTERECKTICTAWYLISRDGHKAGDCKADEQICANVPKVRMIDQEVCVNVPHFSWVSGWRKQWREFKRNGGLAQLKLQSKGLLPLTTQTQTPSPIYVQPITPTQGLDVSGKYRFRLTPKVEEPIAEDGTDTNDEESSDNNNNRTGKKGKKDLSTESKFGLETKDIAIGVGIAVVLFGGFLLVIKKG